MEEEIMSLELSKAFRDALLQDERERGYYTQKNFLLLYDKILKALRSSLLEITLEEEAVRRGTYLKIEKWLSCTQRFQSEYEKQLAPLRVYLLTY